MPELRPYESNSFILESSALEDFLFDRHVVGIPLLNAAGKGTQDWLIALRDNGFLRADVQDCAGLTILTGALYYGLQSAWQIVSGSLLPENFIGVKRHLTERDRWRADFQYLSFEAPCKTVLICDTVASGASVCEAVKAFAQWGRERGLEQVHFFSACGSAKGGRHILQTCESLGLAATFTHGLAAFGLAEKGWRLPDTDLPWLHLDTITDDEHRERAKIAFDGKPVCAIGDWGMRCKNPKQYLQEWEEEKRYWGIRDR